MSLFIGSGVDFVLSMVSFSPSIEHRKQVFDCKANVVDVVYNELMNRVDVYRRLLTNRLHGKAAELYLANS